MNKKISYIIIATVILLAVPLIAMQFTDEVNWNIFDFVIAGFLLLFTGFTLVLGVFKIKSHKYRALAALLLFSALFWIWIELAVGLFTNLGS